MTGDWLRTKFHVERLDGRDQPGGDKADARYFVLDYVHDPYARTALAAYADACEADLPGLAADLRAALGVPVPSEPRCRHCGRSVHQPEPGSYPPGVDWVHEGFTISSTERGNRWCASGKTTAEPRVPEEETRTQVDPASLGVDDLTGAERDAFVALAEHRGEQA